MGQQNANALQYRELEDYYLKLWLMDIFCLSFPNMRFVQIFYIYFMVISSNHFRLLIDSRVDQQVISNASNNVNTDTTT